jgi:P-type E1-E2 ATPase
MKEFLEMDAWMMYPTQYKELVIPKALPQGAVGKEIVANIKETNSVQSCLSRSEIQEELAYINYVFCDKTGTLTQNELSL